MQRKPLNLVRASHHSFVLSQDGSSYIPFEKLLQSDGSWKLLVFLRKRNTPLEDNPNDSLCALQGKRHLSHVAKPEMRRLLRIETILIRPRTEESASNSVTRSDCPPLEHGPTSTLPDARDQFSAKPVFHATETHQPYQDYGIDETAGCLILCRPDQHVAWTSNISEWETLDNFFSLWVGRGK